MYAWRTTGDKEAAGKIDLHESSFVPYDLSNAELHADH